MTAIASAAKREMLMSRNSFLKKAVIALKKGRRQRYENRFFSQRLVTIKCGNFELEAPASHLLADLRPPQPYRDWCVGISARYLAEKYADGTLIDVGANIGDTAAIMATHVQNKLVLIEASDYYFELLSRNARQFRNEIILVKAMVGNGQEVMGTLNYWGGTASFHESTEVGKRVITRRLGDVADEKTCFVKIDTDGFDFRIIDSSMDWLALACPGVLFENQIRNGTDFAASNSTLAKLQGGGYAFFVVWDDTGLHVLSTDSLEALTDLNRYLFKIWQGEGRRSIHNYDVLCLHRRDEDIYRSINERCRSY